MEIGENPPFSKIFKAKNKQNLSAIVEKPEKKCYNRDIDDLTHKGVHDEKKNYPY